MPTPASSAAARHTVSAAFKDLERTIIPADARSFANTTLQNVRDEVLKIENELASRLALRNMRRLAPLFQGLEHYEKVIGVLCNGTPFLPWLWAPISLIIRLVSEYTEAFDHIIKSYSRIAECLKRFAVLDHSFKFNHDFQETVAIFYADILKFHKHAYQFVRRSGWKLFFVTSWHRFQRRFDGIFENLERHASLIDKEANAIDIAEAKQMRQELRACREECSAQLERSEEDQGIKQYSSIVSWLKFDESDQLNIFHTLFEESTKYPGTCDWILRNKKMKSTLQRQPDVPLLWIQGAAGTGKSVLSSSIVNFMKCNDNSLIISHFCDYAYPSSTKYDLILRSLLLQLIRRDGDLAAHIYENYVLIRKTPSIPVLERLLQLLLSSISKQPRQVSYVWIVLDGIDECDPLTQNKIFSLISQVTTRAPTSNDIICKALVSCRYSANASAKLRKSQSISLREEKEQLSLAIRRYACQRMNSIYTKFQQMNLSDHDIKKIEDAITEKSAGMFLYARLVLDYLSSNIFISAKEIKESVYELPATLSEFYSKIITQILVRLDSRSVDRVKCVLGWIAFSKRPLKKIELLSAIAFSLGVTSTEHTAPQYMLDMCATLIEERPDTRLVFIHVSVKEFLQSDSSNLVLVEEECLLQHGITTVTCLLAGNEAFPDELPQDPVLVSIIKGLHGFQIYSKEYWTDYLLALAPSKECLLFDLACELAAKLHHRSKARVQLAEDPNSLVADERQNSAKPLDERIKTLGNPILQTVVERCLRARSLEQLELTLQEMETGGLPIAFTTTSVIPSAQDGVSVILQRYQLAMRNLLKQTEYPGITAAEFDSFKRQCRASAYTCRIKGCPRATDGFERQDQCHDHEILHVRRLICTYSGCQYPPFGSSNALKRHISKIHNPNPPRKSIRKVGHLPPRNLSTSTYSGPNFVGIEWTTLGTFSDEGHNVITRELQGLAEELETTPVLVVRPDAQIPALSEPSVVAGSQPNHQETVIVPPASNSPLLEPTPAFEPIYNGTEDIHQDEASPMRSSATQRPLTIEYTGPELTEEHPSPSDESPTEPEWTESVENSPGTARESFMAQVTLDIYPPPEYTNREKQRYIDSMRSKYRRAMLFLGDLGKKIDDLETACGKCEGEKGLKELLDQKNKIDHSFEQARTFLDKFHDDQEEFKRVHLLIHGLDETLWKNQGRI